jgi:hypothetical protein
MGIFIESRGNSNKNRRKRRIRREKRDVRGKGR